MRPQPRPLSTSPTISANGPGSIATITFYPRDHNAEALFGSIQRATTSTSGSLIQTTPKCNACSTKSISSEVFLAFIGSYSPTS